MRHHVGMGQLRIEGEEDAAGEGARADAMDAVNGGKAAFDLGGLVRRAAQAADLDAQATGHKVAYRAHVWRARWYSLAVACRLWRFALFDRGGLSHVSPIRGAVLFAGLCHASEFPSVPGTAMACCDSAGRARLRPYLYFTSLLEFPT
jgi:hypothetical protein